MLEQMDGTPYCKYNLPIDYLPSRDYRPRWGSTRPLIEPLVRAFEAGEHQFRDFLREMIEASPSLTDVPMDFSEDRLPAPAWRGVPFSPFDGLALYTMIKRHRPVRYLEIGSGISTCFAYKAITDCGLSTTITSIDPEPRTAIDGICDRVIRDGLETAELAIFDELEAGDILFLDGSHRVFMNSDVTVFFIDILPRLKPGVVVHIHDISLPWDYNEMFSSWYWSEQYMLAVYLIASADKVEVLLPTTWICRKLLSADHIAQLKVKLDDESYWYGGGSLWFRSRCNAPT